MSEKNTSTLVTNEEFLILVDNKKKKTSRVFLFITISLFVLIILICLLCTDWLTFASPITSFLRSHLNMTFSVILFLCVTVAITSCLSLRSSNHYISFMVNKIEEKRISTENRFESIKNDKADTNEKLKYIKKQNDDIKALYENTKANFVVTNAKLEAAENELKYLKKYTQSYYDYHADKTR